MTREEMSRLIAQAVGGNLLSLEVLYQELRDPVYALALALTRSPASAYEVTRKTFVQLSSCLHCPGKKAGRQWVIRRACTLARALPAANPPPAEADQTMEKYLMRQAFLQLPANGRQVLLLSVSGESLVGCAAILRRPQGLVRRWYREAVGSLARVLKRAPKSSLSDQPEGQIRKLLKSALSLLEAPSFERICGDIHQYAASNIARRPISYKTVISAAVFLCALAGAAWALSANRPQFIPYTPTAAERTPAQASSESGVSVDYWRAENRDSGAVLYNVVPSDTSELSLYDWEEPPVSLKKSSDAGRENIGSGLAFYLDKNGGQEGFDVVVCGESLSIEERQRLQEVSLLALGGGDYYFHLGASQIEYLAESGLPVELVGAGAPVRPEGIPQNVDNPTAWVLKKMASTEKTRVRYRVTLTVTEEELEPFADLLSSCGIAGGPGEADAQPDSQDSGQVHYSALLALTADQLSRLAQYNASGEISAAFLESPELDAEKDYYYAAYGDGWVMK